MVWLFPTLSRFQGLTSAEYYYIHDDPLALPTEWGKDKCGTFNSREDEDYELAAMSESEGKIKDFLTICPGGWGSWEHRISVYKTKSLTELKGQDIDDILETTPEATLLHEMTHAASYFRESLLGMYS